jgi:hypothetical protein
MEGLLCGEYGARKREADYTELRNKLQEYAQGAEKLRNSRTLLLLALTLLMGASKVGAQTLSNETQSPSSVVVPAVGENQAKIETQEHRFWDKQNDWLFAGVGAARTFDYFSTLNLRRRGDQEILLTNDIVDNHAAFAAIEAAGTGASIAASYLFHRYGHHKLERWTSIVHFGLTTTGAVRNYCLKTAHPKTTP